MQTGDIIVYEGKHWRDRLIRLWSKYSHVAMVVRMPFDQMEDRVCTIDTVFPKAQFNALSIEMQKHGTTFWMPIGFSVEYQEKLAGFLFDVVAQDTPYDVWGLVQTAFTRIRFSKDRYYCSALIAAALNCVGWGIKKVPTPDEVVKIVQNAGVIQREPIYIERD
jgi:hypothetical protein